MKILYIADNFPELGAGSSVRNFYLVKALAEKNSVDVVGLINYKETVKPTKIKNVQYYPIERLPMSISKKVYCISRGLVPFIEQRRSMQLPSEIVNKIDTYDLIHLAELNTYFVIEKYLPLLKAKIILDAHNIEYTKMSTELQKKSYPLSFIGEFFARNIRKLEIACIKKVDHVIVCSKTDKAWYANYIASENITVIPNGVAIAYFHNRQQKTSKKHIVLFMGLLSYFPNEEGIKYYISQIHPSIKQKIIDVELHIIGRNCPAWLKELSEREKSIQIFGFVPDQRPYIRNAGVCIAPLLTGSGTRLKILEYMAMRKAVVSTSKGAEGIAVTNNTDIVLADTPSAFIQDVIALLTGEKSVQTLGQNAEKLIKQKYDWTTIGKTLTTVYTKQITVT